MNFAIDGREPVGNRSGRDMTSAEIRRETTGTRMMNEREGRVIQNYHFYTGCYDKKRGATCCLYDISTTYVPYVT
jgi:hypothetical protein